MKILFVHSGADLYGASRSLLRLTKRLAREKNEVMVILPCDGPLYDELEHNEVGVVVQRNLAIITRREFRSLSGILQFTSRLPFSIIGLWKVVRQFRPDLIHSNTALIVSSGIVSRLSRVSHIWHVREFFSEFRTFWMAYQWFMFAFSDLIVCVSSPVADQFYRPIRARRVVVVHNGIPTEELMEPIKQRVDQFRNEHGLDGYLLVGVVGRIKFRRKGQEVFVKAAAILKDKYPHVKFLCIGSPSPGNEDHLRMLTDLVERLGLNGHFVCTGDVPDVQAAHEALAISVLPSVLPEPFGGVVIESMAMAKPVIGTRVGGTTEQIVDGVTGFLVEPGDEVSLAQALDRLLSDRELREWMGRNARQRFLKEFEMEAFYEKILSIYRRVSSCRDVQQPEGNS